MEEIVDIKIEQIGSVSISYDSKKINQELKKKSDLLMQKKRINFDSKEEILLIKADVSGSDAESFLLEQAPMYCLYMRFEEQENAFYHNEESGEVFLFDKLSDEQYLIYKSFVLEGNSFSVSDIVDEHFSGYGAFKIEEDYLAIKQKYSSNKNIIILTAIVVALILLVLFMYNMMDDESKPPPPPPPKRLAGISLSEKYQLKNISSIDMIDGLRSEIKKISKSRLTNNGKKREVLIVQKKFTILSPVPFAQKPNGSYYYPNPKLKRGGLVDDYFRLLSITR